MPVILATWEAEAENCLNWEVEVALSQDRATAFQPGQQRETPSQKQNKQTNKKTTLNMEYSNIRQGPRKKLMANSKELNHESFREGTIERCR